MMYTPRLALPRSIPEAIEDAGDGFVVADFRQLGDQGDGVVVGHSPVLAGAVAGDATLRVDAAFPVQLEAMLRWLVNVGHDDLYVLAVEGMVTVMNDR